MHSVQNPDKNPRSGIQPLAQWLLGLAGALVVPLAFLLFAQWPLRDGVQAYSRLANDVAQILFALYAAVAVTAASLANSHLALATPALSAIKLISSWRAWVMLACVAPWALLVLWTALPQMMAAIAGLEKFSEGLTPGYFMLRVALVLLALLVLLHAVAHAVAVWHQSKQPRA